MFHSIISCFPLNQRYQNETLGKNRLFTFVCIETSIYNRNWLQGHDPGGDDSNSIYMYTLTQFYMAFSKPGDIDSVAPSSVGSMCMMHGASISTGAAADVWETPQV